MPPLSINKIEYIRPHEDVGQNLITNGDFETFPTFTAATTSSNVFIDGTAAGSSTNSDYYWVNVVNAAGFQAYFDTSTVFAGSASIRLQNTSTTARGVVRLGNSVAIGSIPAGVMQGLCIPVYPSTSYTITAYIKTSNAATGAVNATWNRYTSTFGSAGSNFTLFGSNNGTQDWTLRSTNVTTGSTDAYMGLFLANNTAGNVSDAWFDSVTLKAATVNGQVEVLIMPVVAPGIQQISGPKIWG